MQSHLRASPLRPEGRTAVRTFELHPAAGPPCSLAASPGSPISAHRDSQSALAARLGGRRMPPSAYPLPHAITLRHQASSPSSRGPGEILQRISWLWEAGIPRMHTWGRCIQSRSCAPCADVHTRRISACRHRRCSGSSLMGSPCVLWRTRPPIAVIREPFFQVTPCLTYGLCLRIRARMTRDGVPSPHGTGWRKGVVRIGAHCLVSTVAAIAIGRTSRTHIPKSMGFDVHAGRLQGQAELNGSTVIVHSAIAPRFRIADEAPAMD